MKKIKITEGKRILRAYDAKKTKLTEGENIRTSSGKEKAIQILV